MPGVVFLIVVPTANFEREAVYGGHQWSRNELPSAVGMSPTQLLQKSMVTPSAMSGIRGNNDKNLNINFTENNAILRLEVELRDKNAAKNRRGGYAGRGGLGMGIGQTSFGMNKINAQLLGDDGNGNAAVTKESTEVGHENFFVPMEKILEDLLEKLEIGHVTWSSDKKGWYHHVVFPLQSGEPCETTLHCLTELGIGTKLNSSVSVLPCSVSYDAISDAMHKNDYSNTGEDLSKWNNFVESIKSKLTVKQVVDGVRAGGSLSFDYLLLIVTADSLAALGLVENNAPNIVAAMLVSPLMGPVMSITFGAIISDRELMKVGFISLGLGMLISIVFGFVFGLILGTTDMPWGFGDWPTEEMRARGNARSLWMGVLWALTSGTGVAVALLQGSAGPLIGVAISASLLPPVVNCGLFWALACIWLIYPDIKMPHLKGEPYIGNSSYEFLYTNYLPTEFLVNGIVSGLLTIVNVICIFITAIIVLKIKEVSAPYTASPDLKRFWTTDLGIVRKTNRTTIRKKNYGDKLPTSYEGITEPRTRELDTVLEQVIKEATEDATFRKVKRMSYSSNAAGELSQRLASISGNANGSGTISPGKAVNHESARNSLLNVDLQALDKLVSAFLKHQSTSGSGGGGSSTTTTAGGSAGHTNSAKLSRWRPLSRSVTSVMRQSGSNSTGVESNLRHSGDTNNSTSASVMPTIMEQNHPTPNSSRRSGSIRNVLNTITNAPQRFSHGHDEENTNLTQNILN